MNHYKDVTSLLPFLPERDYVTFGCLLSQIRQSSVVCLWRSCTLPRGLNLLAIFLRHCVP